MTLNPQANTNPTKSCSLDELKQELLDEIDSLHYMGEQEKTKDIDKYFAKIQALITEARIDEVQNILNIRTPTNGTTTVKKKAENRLKQLKENK